MNTPSQFPVCWNIYGMKTQAYTSLYPAALPRREFIVQTFDTSRIPRAQCFTLNYGEGSTFAKLPPPSVFPAMGPVFAYLDTHLPDLQIERTVRRDSVSTILILRQQMPAEFHAITLQTFEQLRNQHM